MIHITLPRPDRLVIGTASEEEHRLHGHALAQHFDRDVVFRAEGYAMTFAEAMRDMSSSHDALARIAVEGMDSTMGALL